MEALSAAQDDSSGANPSSIKSDDSSPQRDNGSSSPPPNCAICLGTCRNKSFTDSCLHQFCFSCLLTWSKVKAVCPLCKQSFRSIIHNVRSNHQYEEYMVVQRQNEEPTTRIDFNSVVAATRRFRYRTTLTLPRRETIAIQQLLLQYPLVADVFPTPTPRATPSRRRRDLHAFRRTVYRHNLWARPLPDFTGRYRDCSPEFYRCNDTQAHRLVPWLDRELHYLLNENVGHISYVIARILELLPQHHINSSEFREAMQRYFGDRTEHFLHELYCFASTPYDITGYDRNVQYTTDSRISTMVNEVISSSDSEASVDSDIVVMVSGSDAPEPPPGPSRLPTPVYPQNYISQPVSNNVIPIETISHSDTDDDSSEVMVVGYIKPPQERTPEVVDLLGSDSDVIVQDTPQPEPARLEIQENRSTSAVKLTLKRHRTRDNMEPDSDDSTYTPPSRRRRARSRHSANDSLSPGPEPPSDSRSELESCASTFTAPTSTTTSPSLPFSSSSSTSTDSSSDESYDSSPRMVKKKSKRKSNKRCGSSKDRKRSKKRYSRSNRDKTNVKGNSEKVKRSKHKSHSGKGVKSSKRNSEKIGPSAARTPRTTTALDEAGPSGRRREGSRERKRRRRDGRETKRLKSVVSIMDGIHRKSGGSTLSGYNGNLANNSKNIDITHNVVSPNISDERIQKMEVTSDHELPGTSFVPPQSDSDDDLPLNLTLKKLIPQS